MAPSRWVVLRHVHHEVGTALEIVSHTERDRDEAQVAGRETCGAEDPEALVLDGVSQGVDGVVVADDGVGLDRVLLRQRGGGADDRVDGQRRQVHDLDPQVVDPGPQLRVGHRDCSW